MRKVLLLTALFASSLLASSARAADPASVSGVEKYLRDDEKAFLAAILTHPDVSAEFDAEAPLALKDPKNLGPFLGVWRAKMEAYAELDGKRGNPDLEGHYSNYAQLMTPEQRAYMVRRLPTMKEDDRNSLIDYLKSVNDALAKNGSLTWYTKKVVAGIMDHYRQDLNTYVATPIAQTARRDAAASAAAFAAIQKAAAPVAAPVTPPTTVPAVVPPVKAPPVVKPTPIAKPAPTTQPVAPVTPTTQPTGGSVVTTGPTGGALDQARRAAEAGAQGGQVFDGGAGARPPVGGDATIVPPTGGAGAGPVLTPTSGDGKPNLTAALPSVPSPVPADANFMSSIEKMQTKPSSPPLVKRLAPLAGGLLGALLGGVIGFLLGGPVGAVAGIAIGAGAGVLGGQLISKKLFQ